MFYFDDFYGKKVLKSDYLSGLDCFFTSKDFVLTAGALNELEQTAENNRRFLMQKLNCSNLITAEQVHGSNIETVQKDKFYYEKTDALISNIENSVILMNFADCTPVILYSKKDNTGAVIHAGWRGTAQKIAQKTAERMCSAFNIKPEDITALIFPAIGKCCFETDEEVFEQLIKDKSRTDLYEKRGVKYFINLPSLNRLQLAACGIKNIDISSYCTFCMSDIFFSYRKEKGKTARNSAVLKIIGDK